jgi:protein-tyrosine phosphatase
MIGRPTTLQVLPNPRVGAYYGVGSLVTLVCASLALPWTGVLVWPSAALFIVMTAYYGRGPGVFRKTEGRLPFAVRFVFGPVLLGHQLSLRWYRRRCRAWDPATPGVWIGRLLTDSEAAGAIAKGVTSVLDLTSEFSEARPFLGIHYRNLPILDLTAPTANQLREAVDFITSGVRTGTIYVHCKIGYSRSVAVVGAYLLDSGKVQTAEEAIKWLRQARPSVVVRPEVASALREFEQSLLCRSCAPTLPRSTRHHVDPAAVHGVSNNQV